MPTASTQTKNKPLVLTLAEQGLERLAPHFFQKNRQRHIRPERFSAIKAILLTILRHTSLKHQGACMRICPAGKSKIFLPCSVAVLTKETGINQRRAERCLRDLREAELLQAPKQMKKPIGKGLFQVFVVRRSLTALFWEALGLTKQYLHDCGHMVMACVDDGMDKIGFVRVDSAGRYRRCAEPKEKGDAPPGYNASGEILPSERKRQIEMLAKFAEQHESATSAQAIRTNILGQR